MTLVPAIGPAEESTEMNLSVKSITGPGMRDSQPSLPLVLVLKSVGFCAAQVATSLILKIQPAAELTNLLMLKVLEEAIASSSAHGISRAAATKAKLVRVMWILLFIIFLAIFLKSGISLVLKLNENKLTKIYHFDQAPFVFPDLYFCPSNPYSGSYPFSLTNEEADLLNNEVSRLIAQFGKLYDYPESSGIEAYLWAIHVQMSFPFHLLARYMLVRKEQSVLSASVTIDYENHKIKMKTFYNYENLICFQLILTDEYKQSMLNNRNSIELRLSTDPHLPDLNFSGYTIQPISDDYNSVPFLEWHPTQMFENLKVSGFQMLTVPPGAYPSLKYENSFHMAPGNAYIIKLKMTENTCSEELHKTHCIASHPQVGFTNPMTEERELFSYSSAACNYMKIASGFVEKRGCQYSREPSLWEFRDHPHCYNISELTKVVLEKKRSTSGAGKYLNFELGANKYCRTRIPCSYPKYSASYSFGKWPSIGSSTVKYFADYVKRTEADAPALARVSKIAKALQSGNHSAHLEGIFRSYVSESMLSVRISIDSVTSPQVVLTWAYTLTDFLADTGGLLGLYIGCSVLTLCELLELIYICVSLLLKKRLETRSAAGGAMEAGVGDADENVAL